MIAQEIRTRGALRVVPFAHPQGCRAYLIADPVSGQAMAVDVHLDLVGVVAERVREEGWKLPYIVDTHTHADHPSGAGALAGPFSSTRVAHKAAQHDGVARHPADGETLHLGDQSVTIHHAPGHTPDHIVLISNGALFSGDSVFIGGVARTDFLGGDAGVLFDTIHRILADLPDETVVYPGHDYNGEIESTVGHEKLSNPWLQIEDRAEFVRALTANPPPRPANMDDLLRLNRKGVDIPAVIDVRDTIARVAAGGATSIIDVRTGAEVAAEQIAGARHVSLDQVVDRADEIRAAPAPRLLLCRTGRRASMALEALQPLGVSGLSVIEGGIEAYRAAGGETVQVGGAMSLERQVRIAAGLLVLVGSAIAFFVHPVGLALAAFVGAGLTFAGVTDTCGMGMMLAKMPWNRGPKSVETGGTAGGCAASLPPAGGCAASAPPVAGGCAASLPPK